MKNTVVEVIEDSVKMNKNVKALILTDLTEILSKIPSGMYLNLTHEFMYDRMVKSFKYTLEEFEKGLNEIVTSYIVDSGITTLDNTEYCIYTKTNDVARYTFNPIRKVKGFTEFTITNIGESSLAELEELKEGQNVNDFNFMFLEHMYHKLIYTT